MPFNERGEWITLDPLQTYLHTVRKSAEQPGSGGMIWTNEQRNKLHDNATLYEMERRGIPYSEEAFLRIRNEIGYLVNQVRDADLENSFKPEPVAIIEPVSPFYKHPGD